VKELEQALLDGRADLAVHSAKDLPADLPEGLEVVGIPPREDPRDVLVGAAGGLAALPAGAAIGTGSPRRSVQITAARPDVEIVPIRGNVGTRLGRVGDDLDAVVLAAAGLSRLGIVRDDVAPLDPEVCTPAPGQGFLAIEGVAGSPAAAVAKRLERPRARVCLQAERHVLRALGGGCMQPVGALAYAPGDDLSLTVFAGSADGLRGERVHEVGPADAPEAVAERAAGRLRGVRA
jgi:hydroxymethylbilane synthase